ncbi:nucleotide sugar dehydrogenase (plasmid) [Rhizobium rosettiformans]|uniref:UDP-glucose 6-dehydrogenase n=1 Tax=Rhizobium rosettiformans TaxID=1368430 RepID=A0ABX7F1A1_9HYPH|nr:nucleotide sugar dehydrogenase [Rhizobium rosettiformans]QRF54327.1 nucleotide sugar dehydrogenase [Rhizobium rosettiformans]
MKIAIFGMGYVGFTAACCITSEGHTVVGVDVSETKIAEIGRGIAPFQEPGLQELMQKALDAKLLSATQSVPDALIGTDLAIVCVGTPSGTNGAHDMRYIADVTRQIGKAMAEMPEARLTVSYRSTMRPGTCERLISPIFRSLLGADWHTRISLVYNPEFLREATAIHDYFNPPKIVIGTSDGQPSKVMDALHENIKAPVFYTCFEEAEITKFVDNSWHAVKVAFANEIGRICERLGISAAKVHEIFVSDTKLNISPYYTRPGGAFGGSCLPKDVRALTFIAHDVNAQTHLLDSLLRSNEAHKNHQFEAAQKLLPQTGGRVLMVGLAFKAGTDDLRESPNVDLARKLLEAGHKLFVFDPNLEPARLRGQNLGYVYSALPTIDELLVDKPHAEAEQWDLVVVNNTTSNLLNLVGQKIYITYSIS